MKALKYSNKMWIERSNSKDYTVQLSLPISNNIYCVNLLETQSIVKDSHGELFDDMSLQDVLVEFISETIEEKSKIKGLLSIQEQSIDGAVSKEELETLLKLNQDVHYLKATLASLENITTFIYETNHCLLDVDHLNVKLSVEEITYELETIQSEINSLIDISDLIYSQKQNNYVKRLSILTILFSIPTFITSFYGMNIALPFQSHPYLPIILLIFSLILMSLTIWLIRHLETDQT
ncbi:CorA family divalent cation transporter [Erysipelothrix urinaevulpis]|uniref:CorA family divalent cation transporter n=1 Tax=Erysipelothrix urinaevulpis TaxID=2683717 RepID=UPI00135A0DDC|nr:CorA family divalent cation transporter [Erysipelothrix urinaevulpis]